VYERLRFAHHFGKFDGERFKLPNNHTPFYARLVNERYPDFFVLHRLADEAAA
jgi:hypothetical protein